MESNDGLLKTIWQPLTQRLSHGLRPGSFCCDPLSWLPLGVKFFSLHCLHPLSDHPAFDEAKSMLQPLLHDAKVLVWEPIITTRGT
mmetsp:Transcript_22439/g.45421  ORF Transcript_22439/g.45421 Transcript_22439/m.45421 type:complete len:86 (+) Transcript_22439:106-363(+)